MPWVRVGTASRGKGLARILRRGAWSRIASCLPRVSGMGSAVWAANPGNTQEQRSQATGEADGEKPGIGRRSRGRARRRAGKPGKSAARRRRRRKVGIDASVFCCHCCARTGSQARGKAVERWLQSWWAALWGSPCISTPWVRISATMTGKWARERGHDCGARGWGGVGAPRWL